MRGKVYQAVCTLTCHSWRHHKTGVAAFTGFATHAEPVRFESLEYLLRGVLTTPPFAGPFCRPFGAQSTTQPWHTAPLILNKHRLRSLLLIMDHVATGWDLQEIGSFYKQLPPNQNGTMAKDG